jgi:hypothetical protein
MLKRNWKMIEKSKATMATEDIAAMLEMMK